MTEDEMVGWRSPPLHPRDGDPWADSMDMSLSKLRELVMDREAWHAAVHGVAKRWARLSMNHPIPCLPCWFFP